LGGHAVFDVGAHGYMNAGHAHADALSLTLSLANRPLLVDPGTSTYTMEPRLRDRMRGTSNHNTVTVDGRPIESDAVDPRETSLLIKRSMMVFAHPVMIAQCLQDGHDLETEARESARFLLRAITPRT